MVLIESEGNGRTMQGRRRAPRRGLIARLLLATGAGPMAAGGVPLLALLVPLPALAQANVPASTNADNQAPASAPPAAQQADAAFQRGLALLEQRRYPEACEQFELSQRLDPSPGTLLNLGNCREQEGDLVQALATFEQALAGARDARDPRRKRLWSDAARERVGGLALRVPQVTLRGLPEGAQVALDDRPVVDPGAPLRLNPGSHRLTVAAPGRAAFGQLFEVALGEQRVIDVLAPPTAPTPDRSEPTESRYGLWPYFLGAGGALLLGTSLVTGLAATSASDDLQRGCVGTRCDPSLEPTRDRAERLARFTDVFWIAGAAAAGASVALFVLEDGDAKPTSALQAGCFGAGCGLVVRGNF